MRYQRITIVAVVLSAGIGFLIYEHSRNKEYREFMSEIYAFRELSLRARRLIELQQGRAYLRSFSELHSYITLHVSEGENLEPTKNPFPDILPNQSYSVLVGTSESPQIVLIASNRVYKRPWGKVQVVLLCDGSVECRVFER